jgi:hypothetical protein
MRPYISYSQDFKKTCDSVRREVLFNSLIVWVHMKLVRLNKNVFK